MNRHFHKDLILIQQEIDAAWKTEVQQPARRRAPLLRSSSLPYCPLRDFAEVLEHGVPETEAWSLDGELYTGIGHHVHTVLQNWMPRHFERIDVVAQWDAQHCGVADCPMKEPGSIHGLNREGCERCGQHPEHVELERYGQFTSHIDKVYRIRGTRRAYIIDVKTCSLRKVWDYKAGREQHPHNYVFQVDSYAVQLAPLFRRLGLRLCGTMILYVPRDTPRERYLMPVRTAYPKELLAQLETRLNRVSAGWREVGRAIREDDWSASSAKRCERQRLCGSRAFYEGRVHNRYDPCPMSDVCFDKQARRKHLRQLLRKYGGKS